MILYEVTVSLDDPARAPELEAYMRGRHIPQIFDTGCFAEIRFCRLDDGRFRTTYAAAARADLDRYLSDHSAALREDFARHFPTGVDASRQVCTVLESWG